ncbi:hypothetical protein BGZ65_007945, partial [Modicella reniformis]
MNDTEKIRVAPWHQSDEDLARLLQEQEYEAACRSTHRYLEGKERNFNITHHFPEDDNDDDDNDSNDGDDNNNGDDDG